MKKFTFSVENDAPLNPLKSSSEGNQPCLDRYFKWNSVENWIPK